MNVDLLAIMLKELILENDRVAFPGIGTFVAENVPATFVDRGYTINPPYRRLSFRPNVSDDGLLAGLYSRANNLDIETSRHIVNTFLSEMKEVLHAKKIIILPGLGRLRATKENNYFFIPDLDLNIDVESWGLEALSLKTHEETREEVSAALDDLKSIMNEPAKTNDVDEVEESAEPAKSAKVDKEEMKSEEAGSEVVDKEEMKSEEAGAGAKEQTHEVTSCTGRRIARIVVYSLLAFVVLLLLFIVLSRVAPGAIQKLLYSPEELEIINYIVK